ncbi:unnamed protein product [Sphagnum jensenii]|uniref:3-hydroxy-3-methylglutaryl coenzyme A reductase n=1 Tax=Sphagnum jensenii TaxID=128206 RepID=A0ABP0V6Y7_9BRYO
MNQHGLTEGFYRLTQKERLERVGQICDLTEEELNILSGRKPLAPEIAENLIENVVGYFPIPLGVATNFTIDGRDLLIPMAVEETSIIAAASATAKWVRNEGSINTYTKGNLIIGQVQFPFVKNVAHARKELHKNRDLLIALANTCLPGLVARGGGVRDIAIREIPRPDSDGTMLVLHLLCDPCDAMGANLINQVCEALKPRVESLTGEKVGLCILSNLVDGKLAAAEVVVRNVDPVIGKGIEEATLFAQADPYRAATHNKGVLNGIDPILIATGNDWRAIEAGAHAYAARKGQYQPLTHWKMEGSDLIGRIELPMAVGIVGGVTQVHPTARVALKMMKIERSEDLARICAAAGLIQNLGALKALATVGIVKGHMQLHAANLAIAAGAEIHEVARLEEPLRLWVSLTYLICRVLDTVEDAPWPLNSNLKNVQFESFLRFLKSSGTPADISSWTTAFPAGITTGERLLLADSQMIFADLHSLPSEVREAICETAERMQLGMNYFSEMKLHSLVEVNQYCYFVAGIVGELLTRLVALNYKDYKLNEEVFSGSLHFGLFLQKVNLLKDQATDEKEGRFLVPNRRLVWNSALRNAWHAFEYLKSIPKSARGYRVFCAWSFFLGLYSLPFIKEAEETHSLGKVPRELMWPLLKTIEDKVLENDALTVIFEEALAECQLSDDGLGRPQDSDSLQGGSDWFIEMANAPVAHSSLSHLRLI